MVLRQKEGWGWRSTLQPPKRDRLWSQSKTTGVVALQEHRGE